MTSRCKKWILIVAVLVFASSSVFATITLPDQIFNNSDDLLASTVPISYGEKAFRQKILERTRGEREPVGLVLSGGSARAFAHIGVLTYLEEQGIVPDYIISNSMGSIVALLYAAGLSPEQIITVCNGVDIGQLFDLTLPLNGGILDTSRFSAIIEAFLGEQLRLEDLPLPVMVVAEDLATKRQVHIMEGDFISILEASFVLPIYFSPVEFNGHLLIDGGITNLVPLEAAYAYGDTVIVSTTFYEGRDINLRNSVSILNVAFELSKRRQGVYNLLKYPETLWIRCDVEDFSFMDFASIDQISLKGYRSAELMREQIRALSAGGAGEEMRVVRANFSAKEQQILQHYKLFSHTNQRRISHQLFVGLNSYHYDGDPWFLKTDNIIGLDYDLRWRSFEFSINAGLGWKAVTPMDLYPSSMFSLEISLLPFLMSSVDLGITWDSSWLPSYYNRVAFEGRHLMMDDRLELQGMVSLENHIRPNMSLGAMSLIAGAHVGWHNLHAYPFSVSFDGGWQLAHSYDRNFIYTKFRSSFPLPEDFEVSASYNGRFALDGRGDVPFYLADQFRTVDATLLSQGSLSPVGASNPANHMITSKISACWTPQAFKPTVGEMIIFNDTSMGIYANLLWKNVSQILPDYSVGAEISTELSLLGLKGMHALGFVGYDGLAQNVVWGFIFSK